MIDEVRSLEAELRQLHPARPSRRVKAGLARRLARPRPAPRLLGLAALAASVLLLWLAWPAPPAPRPQAKAPAAATAAPARWLPTLATYRQALAGSPEELERLLDRQAAEATPEEPPPSFVALSSPALPD
jgi:hypothetical protein